MKKKLILILFLAFLILSSGAEAEINTQAVEKLDYEVINSYYHDPEAFTQGLELYNDYLYEGTGLYGRSSLRKIAVESGEILKEIDLNKKYFGEGITILNQKIYQLSWKENTAFVYDLDFNLINTFNYQGEGWGLANNDQHLLMSNGSHYIFFRSADTFETIKKIEVKIKNEKVNNLNELEYHNGYIYANIWQKDYIVKINAETGEVEAYLDLNGILETNYEGEIDVLNGIAYNPENKSFLITGKLWPKIYEIKIKNK
ncbi:MAG: glutaminyl-peptide cyclotransferase [Halanaerobium sp.]